MTEASQIFTDGKAYERMMGRWTRRVGETFFEWLDVPEGQSWLDVGCGTGALLDKFFAKDDTFKDEPADKLYNEGLYLLNEKSDPKAASKKFELPPEQALALTTVDLPGAFHIISSCFKDEPKITQAFRTGDGVGWHEHDANLFFGTERFFRPNYEQNLLSSWIPALEGVGDKLSKGAVVADVVYAPLETGLLKGARARGLRAADGLGMLLHQAVGGFERWFGVRPNVTEALRTLVEADLIRK